MWRVVCDKAVCERCVWHNYCPCDTHRLKFLLRWPLSTLGQSDQIKNTWSCTKCWLNMPKKVKVRHARMAGAAKHGSNMACNNTGPRSDAWLCKNARMSCPKSRSNMPKSKTCQKLQNIDQTWLAITHSEAWLAPSVSVNMPECLAKVSVKHCQTCHTKW